MAPKEEQTQHSDKDELRETDQAMSSASQEPNVQRVQEAHSAQAPAAAGLGNQQQQSNAASATMPPRLPRIGYPKDEKMTLAFLKNWFDIRSDINLDEAKKHLVPVSHDWEHSMLVDSVQYGQSVVHPLQGYFNALVTRSIELTPLGDPQSVLPLDRATGRRAQIPGLSLQNHVALLRATSQDLWDELISLAVERHVLKISCKNLETVVWIEANRHLKADVIRKPIEPAVEGSVEAIAEQEREQAYQDRLESFVDVPDWAYWV